LTEKEAVYYELLAVRCRLGRRDALEELVRIWEKRLFYYIRMLVSLLFFLVRAVLFMIRAFVPRSELNTPEKLLEIEYRLAELADKIENKSSE
jgi:hypothetical protein